MRLGSLLGPDIKQLLREDPDQLRALADEIHPEDLADIVGELEPDEAAALLARWPAQDAAPIFERLRGARAGGARRADGARVGRRDRERDGARRPG